MDVPRNLDFWLMPRRAGCPRKIYPLPSSAVPPTCWEGGGGHYRQAEQAAHMASLMVPGLDEVTDWPAVADAADPAYPRLWGG